MIFANEVRQGNKVLFGVIPVTIEGIHTYRMGTTKGEHFYVSGFVEADNYYAVEPYNLDPMPLTPGIMEKFGFVQDGFKQYPFPMPMHPEQFRELVLDLRGGYIWLREGSGSDRTEDSLVCLWNRDLTPTLHFHEFQNLYFALTRQELPINLQK